LFGIEVADPGAVPGASTIDILWGRNRIDVLNKETAFTQYDSAVIFDHGSKKVNANDNSRMQAVA
jgi:hypothetical protein